MDHELVLAEGSVVKCARCGQEFTHQGTVLVHARPREDGPGREIRIDRDGLFTTPLCDLSKDSPAFWGRRQDVVIELTCENCGTISELIIAQHKGQTLLRIRDSGRAVTEGPINEG